MTEKRMRKGKIAVIRQRKKEKGSQRDRNERGSIWNPANLQKEVHAFGYNFKWTTYLLTVFCVVFLLAAVGMFFKLKTVFFVPILLVMVFLMPVFIIDMYRRM